MILTFLWAKLTRNETALERLSLPPQALMADLKGKTVALIGNAKSLSQGQFGPQIELADPEALEQPVQHHPENKKRRQDQQQRKSDVQVQFGAELVGQVGAEKGQREVGDVDQAQQAPA